MHRFYYERHLRCRNCSEEMRQTSGYFPLNRTGRQIEAMWDNEFQRHDQLKDSRCKSPVIYATKWQIQQ
jgi:hypothetical protein